MDQWECKDAKQWNGVNLRIIGGKIRHEKRIIKGHLNWLVVSYGETKFGRQKGRKKGSKGDKILQPLSKLFKEFSCHFKCSSCPRSALDQILSEESSF